MKNISTWSANSALKSAKKPDNRTCSARYSLMHRFRSHNYRQTPSGEVMAVIYADHLIKTNRNFKINLRLRRNPRKKKHSQHHRSRGNRSKYQLWLCGNRTGRRNNRRHADIFLKRIKENLTLKPPKIHNRRKSSLEYGPICLESVYNPGILQKIPT